ncbi:MAG: diaminopimelate decarboxylase [Eggerthellaceae bacterium]|nr:diaminopimelate decarboxylase [Eggerthellaceae bacterium]
MLHSNLTVNEEGHLVIAGIDSTMLAQKYGTPLYILDEDRIRKNMRLYVDAMHEYFGRGARPLYASKALSFRGIYKIAAEEKMCVDIVSAGELYTALSAGFPAKDMYFHGNNKTDTEIRYAIDNRIGYFIVDNDEELDAIDKYAAQAGIVQDVLLRVTPGIDPHTFAAVNTGQVDCQFGISIETGQAARFVGNILNKQHVSLRGFHCHIGSQIFDQIPFCDAADIMLKFIVDMRTQYGYTAEILNLGGGFGVRYVETDPQIDIADNIRLVSEHIEARCNELDVPYPVILMEPGRSIVADAGVTLYTVGSVKTIDGYRSYVSVDGGMSDNPRYALYGSEYTVHIANRMNENPDFLCTVAGRCCETDALIQENVMLPHPVRGDILAVLVTGAYNYSMASNYNRICRPPIVMVSGGKDRIVVRRETFEDLTACDM